MHEQGINIMKHTDGMFHQIFDEIKEEYPEIESEHYIIDIGSARLANSPERFDVIVTLNLYGDIISDITAEISGSVGLGGSANIGQQFAMFEAIHGSAPDIAGKNIANPSGLLNAATMMLMHINMPDHAELIQNALYRTIEDGIHTPDMWSDYTKKTVGTKEFGEAIIERLGQTPNHLKISKPTHHQIVIKPSTHKREEKLLTGVDVFIDWVGTDRNPDELGHKLQEIAKPEVALKMITNRGVKVFPDGRPETFCTDHWRCRFIADSAYGKDPANLDKSEKEVSYQTILNLLSRLEQSGLNFIKIENLYEMDGKRAYSLGQGE